jgi:phospholipase C
MKSPRRAGLALLLALAGCVQGTPVVTGLPGQQILAPGTNLGKTSSKIRHVVIIFQENRSTDDLFNGFPGADTVRSGLNSKGQRVPLKPVSISAPYDLGHTHHSFEVEYADGKLNGFDEVGTTCRAATVCTSPAVSAYGYVPHDQIKPYFIMATRYAFADHMFQTNQGPSFPAHQYIVSGTSTVTNGSMYRASENPFRPSAGPSGGCDSPAGSLVELIDSAGAQKQQSYPCFDRISLMELVDRKSLTWRYYQATPGPGIWNAPDAVLKIRMSREFSSDVVTPSSQILTDIAKGQLANVVWVTPTGVSSDHPLDTNGSGPSWVASIVNAIGESRFWSDTAIFVTWDDWGGWYDHVAPPQYNSYELSFRVPLIVISPYAKNHYISHREHEFASILKFAEKIFGLPSLHTTDVRSDDLFDCFDFSKPPAKFKRIPAKFPPSYFLLQRSTEVPND